MNSEQKNKFHMFFFEEHISAVYYFFTGTNPTIPEIATKLSFC